MSARCRHCQQPEEEHHVFEAEPMPEGCVCDPESWPPHEEIPPACEDFRPWGNIPGYYCAVCKHDEPCHRSDP